ncbi:MAG: CotH kinase family protein [Saprospiraceae bacterium]|nr:CotH kinase family protein [Saprospiraceae bacterium]
MRNYTLLFLLTIFLQYAVAQSIYDVNSITEVKIYFQEKNWDAILDSLKTAGNDDRLTGDVTINGKKYAKAGIRYKGNSSYKNPRGEGHIKLPFNIKINDQDKKQLLPGGYGTLKLSNAFRDPSFVRELLSYEIARNYMPAPKANFAKVFVNDQYLGIYQNVESVDDRFLEEFYGNDAGELIKCDPDWSVDQAPGCTDSDKSSLMYIGEDSTCYMRFYELKGETGWRGLIQLAKILNEEPEKLDTLLDIDQALWMLAFNNVLVNLDSYTGLLCHNYYLYRDSLGMYHPIIWDMNLSFGGFRRLTSKGQLTNEEMQTLSPFVHYRENNPKRPLIVKLLANDLYRKIYLAHIRTIVDEYFVNGKYIERAKTLQTFIDKNIKEDAQKLYSYEAFHDNLEKTTEANQEQIIGIAELMNKRTEYLLSHPVFEKEAPKISNVKHDIAGNNAIITAQVENTQSSWLYYRYGLGDNFVKTPMLEDANKGTQVSSGNWSVKITYKKGLQYYIVAEGERVAKLSPERASHEFYSVDNSKTTTNKAK